MKLKVPARVCRGAFGVYVSAVFFDKREKGMGEGGVGSEMADRLLNVMHMEFEAEPWWVTKSSIVKVENTCAIPHHTPLFL